MTRHESYLFQRDIYDQVLNTNEIDNFLRFESLQCIVCAFSYSLNKYNSTFVTNINVIATKLPSINLKFVSIQILILIIFINKKIRWPESPVTLL